jgi:hypothetical protein
MVQDWNFTLVLPPKVKLTGDLVNMLFQAGCDDSTPSRRGGRTLITFSRMAETYAEAVDSALSDVRKVVPLGTIEEEPAD